jgi:hypothetical protein
LLKVSSRTPENSRFLEILVGDRFERGCHPRAGVTIDKLLRESLSVGQAATAKDASCEALSVSSTTPADVVLGTAEMAFAAMIHERSVGCGDYKFSHIRHEVAGDLSEQNGEVGPSKARSETPRN